MNKLYTTLYHVYNFKKQVAVTGLILFIILFTSTTTNGQNPAVTINQAAAQPDPTNTAPINFTVVFDQPVIGFTTGDVVITGTAGAITSVVTGGPITYNVTVAGMTSCGTVIVNIPAGVCTNTLTQPNLASTSIDNTVTYLTGNPNVTINQAVSQPDPTSASPINFTVVFDQVVTGFATGDVTLAGTAGATTGIVTGSGTTYNVAVSGITASGTVIATIAAGVAQACSQPNNASTSTDNTVTITCVPPIVNVTPAASCGGVAGLGCNGPLTASGNADTYIWSPLAGLYNNCQATVPYTGDSRLVVYAAPTVNTIFTVTGTILATGCSKTAMAQINYTPPAPVIVPSSVNMCLGDPAVKLKVAAGGIPAGLAVWSPAAGLFLDAASAIPYPAGTPRDSVWVRPTPAGIYTYQVTVPGIPGPPVAFSNPAAILIPVGGTAALYPSNLTVSGLPTTGVTIRSIVLHGVTHTSSNDIDVVLQSPSGQNVLLMSDAGGSNAINATYTLMDFGSQMSNSAANLTGTYKPSNFGIPDNFPAPGPGAISQDPRISMFTGNYNGTWKLFIVDDDGTSDQGIISGGYTINFDTVTTCYSPPRSVVVSVGQVTTITTQPANKIVCVGNTGVYTVGVAGVGPFTYQWQISTDAGATYNNIVNGGVFNGALTNMLFVTPITVTMNGNLVRVLINGGSGCTGATSTSALLTVNPLPTIAITANPLIIGPTQTTTILSAVTPNPAATYTWYYNNSVLPGAVLSSLVVTYGNPGDYQLRVTDVNGCTNLSNIVTIANSFALNMYTYPNPSGGIFQVRYSSEAGNTLQRSLTVYNNRGEKIITRNFTQTIPYQKIDVDVRANGKGLYWVEVRDANGKRLGINRVVVQ